MQTNGPSESTPLDDAVDRVARVLVSLDHTDDWVRGFGATPDELDSWERDALYAAAREVVDAALGTSEEV